MAKLSCSHLLTVCTQLKVGQMQTDTKMSVMLCGSLVIHGNGFFLQQAAKNVAVSFSLPSELNRIGTNMTSSKHG